MKFVVLEQKVWSLFQEIVVTRMISLFYPAIREIEPRTICLWVRGLPLSEKNTEQKKILLYSVWYMVPCIFGIF